MVASDQHHLEDDNFFSATVYWRMCDLARTLERERDEAREQRTKAVEKYQASIKEMHEVGMQRDRLLKHINVLAYWRDISECDCHNPLPNGGCLRCDLDKVFNSNQQPK